MAKANTFESDREQDQNAVSGNDEVIEMIRTGGVAGDEVIEIESPDENIAETDGRKKSSSFSVKKKIAEGMMDISLLTANANQLRFIITYNYRTKTYYLSMTLIALSLALQIMVGIALIVRRYLKNKGFKELASKYNLYLIIGIFLITVINVLAASFTTTDSAILGDNQN